MRPRTLFPALLLTVAVTATALAQGEPTKLLRFPDIHGDRVVFTYAGDLWTAPATGGTATRLTAHPGLEQFAKFSPDGRWIAFTGQYDGDEQVYVMPAAGGEPRQLTFYPARGPLPPRWGYDNQVYDWTPDGEAVLFRSLREGYDLGESRLFTVPYEGGFPTALPMPVSGAGDLSPDGRQVVYSPLFRDFRAWKRYEGGWAQDLWIFDIASGTARNFTDHARSDRDPMWVGEKIYFTSDRDGTLNVYAFDPATSGLEQVTRSRNWDVRWPGDDGRDRIVYELGGSLQVLDLSSGRSMGIDIVVPDDGVAARPSSIPVAGNIEDFDLGPEGKRALFTARGDIFTVPAEHGPTRNLTRSSGVHDRAASWSPDGRWVGYVSDATGEEEIWLIPGDGSGEPQQLTSLRGRGGRLISWSWAPDSESIAFCDKEGQLSVVTVSSGRTRPVVKNRGGGFGDFAWSPNGGWLAMSLPEESGFGSIWLWNAAGNEMHRVTSGHFNEFNPAWDPEGNYLYYLSDRETAPMIGSFEWNYVVDRETLIYALALRSDVPHPFAPRSDEVAVTAEEEAEGGGEGGHAGAAGQGAADESADDALAIELEGLAGRVVRIPVGAENYGGLFATKGHLWYATGAPFYYGRGAGVVPELKVFSLADRSEQTYAAGVGGGAVSPDGSKLLLPHGGQWKIADLRPGAFAGATAISLRGLRLDRVPAEEWEQIFNEVWRRFRDYFYVENMHGYDWEALRRQYAALLPHVAHRSDLNYVMGEMIAELNAGHCYIAGGDYEIPARAPVALAGALYEVDERAGRYRIAQIWRGDNAEAIYRSPLTEVGIEASAGDYILAINGIELTAEENIYARLRFQNGSAVTFTLNDRPSLEGAREVTFEPITDETNLKYYEWVEERREMVAEMTDGRVGYMHIPDMGANGIREFVKWFYGQVRTEGFIIDVRGNGGGNVSAMLINRLARTLLSTGFARGSEIVQTYPRTVYIGHMVCLLNETSASDGDIFPFAFREAGLGPLIGKRSWGGVVGYTGTGPLIDGGSVNVPQFGFADAAGNYVVEGTGVVPDIEVENDPASILAGRDPQLERGIEEVLRMIAADPRSLPARPRPPIKR